MAIAWPTLMAMAFVTFQTIALVSSMNVGFAMDKGFLSDNVIVKEMWMLMATVHAIISVAGCLDSEACNFDELATVDDGSCEYCSVNFLPQGVIWLLSLLPV